MLRKLEAKLHAKKQGIAEGAHDFAKDAHKAQVRRNQGSGSDQGRSGPAWLAKTWQFELPDVKLPSICATLRLRFPDLEWPELPNINLHNLRLPRINLHDFQHEYPDFQWPSTPNLAFICNLLRLALPDLSWPSLPELGRDCSFLPEGVEWEWPHWELPDVNLSAILTSLRDRFPQLTWPDLPHVTLTSLALPRLQLAEYEHHFPSLAPWPSVPDLCFLLNLLRIAFPDLEWPTTPEWSLPEWSASDISLADWSMPDWSLLEWNLTHSCVDGVIVKLCEPS